MSKLKVRDKVFVIAGKDRGKTGEIVKIFPLLEKAIVSGINIFVKHVKPTKDSPGKIVKKEIPIHISNLAYLFEDNKISKIGYKIEHSKKVRFVKKTGKII